MIEAIVVLVIWNLLLTGCLVGGYFRLMQLTNLAEENVRDERNQR